MGALGHAGLEGLGKKIDTGAYENHVGPSRVSKGPRKDCQNRAPASIALLRLLTFNSREILTKPLGPSRDWKGPKQDGPKTYSILVSEYEDANMAPSPNFEILLASNGLL